LRTATGICGRAPPLHGVLRSVPRGFRCGGVRASHAVPLVPVEHVRALARGGGKRSMNAGTVRFLHADGARDEICHGGTDCGPRVPPRGSAEGRRGGRRRRAVRPGQRAAADPASVETCPYFDAYTEGGEDVTLQCRILDLVGGGRGVVSVFFCVAGGNLSVSPNPAPPRRRPPPSPRAAAGSLRDVGEVFTWGQISADENMFVVALSVSFGRCCLRVRVLSRHFGFSFTPSRTKISVGFFLQNERSEVDAAIYVATGTRGAALK